jgi:predicted transcriptional regulator
MWLISIRPRFVEEILRGRKTVELRRRVPRTLTGERLFVYSTSPVKSIVAIFVARKVVTTSPTVLWQAVQHSSCVSADEYLQYFDGAPIANAIHISHVVRLETPIGLETLRDVQPSFHPPQSMARLTPEMAARLLAFNTERRAA